MATRSTIAVQLADGNIVQVYCHWDGYLSHNGKILLEHYNSQELAELVTRGGDLSTLAPTFAPTASHSFDHPQEGVCLLYGRDRSEPPESALYSDCEDYTYNRTQEEFDYIYINGQWLVFENGRSIKFVPVEDAIKADETEAA